MNAPSAASASPELRRQDAAARKAAQTRFDRPLVLEAGAGTGKTATLVARLVVWCLGPGFERAARQAERGETPAGRVLSRVVAITFTEAASAEMSGRMLDALSECAAAKTPEGVDPKQLGPETAARARQLLAESERLEVSTIHAFCRRLLARHALEAGIPPGFEIDADGARTAEIVRDVLEQALREGLRPPVDPALIALARLGIDPQRLERALYELSMGAVSPAALEQDPFTRARLEVFRAARAAEASALAGQIEDRFDRFPGRSLAAALRDAVAATRTLWASPIPDRDALAARVAELREIWPDRARRHASRWKPGKRERDALVDPETFARLARTLADGVRFCATLEPAALDETRRVLAPLLRRVSEERRLRGITSYDDLLAHACRLLARDSVARGERARIDQLVVDEFQDTDAAQCTILGRLALDPLGVQRPGLFVVGDPKQSIYGWRRADLLAYDEFVERVRASGGERMRLSVSFRADPPLLQEIEACVTPLMHEERGLQPAFQPLIASSKRRRGRGFRGTGRAPVEFWASNDFAGEPLGPRSTRVGQANEREARALARELEALHAEAGVPFSEIALLFRQRSDYDTYLAALRERGVPYRVEGDRGYYERREIVEAAALLRAICDPEDRLALLAWLRSGSVGLPDAALIPLFRGDLLRLAAELPGGDPAALERAVHELAATTPASAPGLDRIPDWPRLLLDALEALGELRRSFADEPADRFVERLRERTGLEATEAARSLGAYRLANLERFLADLGRALDASAGDAKRVARGFRRRAREVIDAEEALPRESIGDAVHVMTIHQAKGLDFEHVYLPQLHKRAGHPPRELELPELAEDGAALDYALFGMPTPGFRDLQARREAVDAAERVRTLYVALTRAKRRLVLVGCWTGEPKAVEQARSHADLLAQRQLDLPSLERAAADAQVRGSPAVVDESGVRLVLLDLEPPALDLRPGSRRGREVRAPAEIGAQLEQLAEARERAARRMRRPFHSTASGPGPDLPEAAGAAGGPERDAAALAGSLVHAALEELDLDAEPAAAIADQKVRLADRVPPEIPGELREQALARAAELLERFAAGPLLDRLRALPRDARWRELPLVAPAGSGEADAVGYQTGVVDLVYRDPQTGELVVADYKTDRRIDATRVERYRAQGEVYTRALQEALRLSQQPRFELWWIEHDSVDVALPASDATSTLRR